MPLGTRPACGAELKLKILHFGTPGGRKRELMF
jgi:hypothetical protein